MRVGIWSTKEGGNWTVEPLRSFPILNFYQFIILYSVSLSIIEKNSCWVLKTKVTTLLPDPTHTHVAQAGPMSSSRYTPDESVPLQLALSRQTKPLSVGWCWSQSWTYTEVLSFLYSLLSLCERLKTPASWSQPLLVWPGGISPLVWTLQRLPRDKYKGPWLETGLRQRSSVFRGQTLKIQDLQFGVLGAD